MNTLYWITVLGNLSSLASVALIIFATLLFLSSFAYFNVDCPKSKVKRFLRISIIGILVSLLIGTLIPSKDELYVIYGVGTVLDYAKSSKEVQKLPDNAVKALNIYLEDIQKRDSMIKQEK